MATIDDYTFAPPPSYPGATDHLGRAAGAELRASSAAEPAPAQVPAPDPDQGRLFTEAAR